MKNEHGFGAIGLILVLVVVVAIGYTGLRVFGAFNKTSGLTNLNKQQSNASCAKDPIIALPVTTSRIKAILYPGQIRGGNFKPHGGFLLNEGNDVEVTLPLDAKVIDGVRYKEGGEIQYMFDFQADCGYQIRLDHLHTLTNEMQKIADKLPQPTEDSRTTAVNSNTIKAGTVVATKVGFIKTANSSFDFGFYNMNKQNMASQQSDWPQDFQYTNELAKHGTCWFDYLSAANKTLVQSLPAGDGIQGKNSLYCK